MASDLGRKDDWRKTSLAPDADAKRGRVDGNDLVDNEMKRWHGGLLRLHEDEELL
jgi:hypothetical protein